MVRIAEAAAVVNARMVFSVAEYVFMAPGYGANNVEIGLKAG